MEEEKMGGIIMRQTLLRLVNVVESQIVHILKGHDAWKISLSILKRIPEITKLYFLFCKNWFSYWNHRPHQVKTRRNNKRVKTWFALGNDVLLTWTEEEFRLAFILVSVFARRGKRKIHLENKKKRIRLSPMTFLECFNLYFIIFLFIWIYTFTQPV